MRSSGSNCWKALAPLDQHHRLAVEDLVEPQRGGFLGAIQAVQIDVVHAAFAVFMDQREGGAGHVLGFRRAQAADDALGQRGLARAEVADQQHHRAFRQRRRNAAAQLDGFFFAVSLK